MGAPAKLDGKAVEGVKIFTGGKIGESPELATELDKGVPATDEHLGARLREMLINEYGATPKAAAV
jgi:ferredoxin-nitrite reductase